MIELTSFGLFGIAIGAFVATNIDDIFILMIFFSSCGFQARDVVLGQYLGIGILTAISAVGSLLAYFIPIYVIGLMGFIPITIGIIRLVRLGSNKEIAEEAIVTRKNSNLSLLTVTAVTFSNGADNIGVYTPLFAKYNGFLDVTIIIIIFMAMTGLWCAIGYYLVNHRLVAGRIRKTGHIILPFVLIGLGLYILVDSFMILG